MLELVPADHHHHCRRRRDQILMRFVEVSCRSKREREVRRKVGYLGIIGRLKLTTTHHGAKSHHSAFTSNHKSSYSRCLRLSHLFVSITTLFSALSWLSHGHALLSYESSLHSSLGPGLVHTVHTTLRSRRECPSHFKLQFRSACNLYNTTIINEQFVSLTKIHKKRECSRREMWIFLVLNGIVVACWDRDCVWLLSRSFVCSEAMKFI